MKIAKMVLNKSALAAMFLVMTFGYSINVQAGVCEAEFNESLTYKLQFYRETGTLFSEERERNSYKETIDRYYESGNIFSYDGDPTSEARRNGLDLDHYIEESKKWLNKAKAGGPEYRGSSDSAMKTTISGDIYNICMLEAAKSGLLKSKVGANNKSKSSNETYASQSANTHSQDPSDDTNNQNAASKKNKGAKKGKSKADTDDASYCIKLDIESNEFINTCDFNINVGYCTLYIMNDSQRGKNQATVNDTYSEYSCTNLGAQQKSWDSQLSIKAHGRAGYVNDEQTAEGIYHIACKSPNRPLGITYDSTRKPVLQAKDCRYD